MRITRRGIRTLRSARPLHPLRHLVSDESVLRLELLEGLVGLVDEGEAGALAAAELRPEAEDGDLVLGGLVQLAELLPQLVLGDVGAVGVEDVAVRRQNGSRCFGDPLAGDSHDHLLALEQRVPDELARPQGYLRVGHGGGVVEKCLVESCRRAKSGSRFGDVCATAVKRYSGADVAGVAGEVWLVGRY
jgi:hypothetical protein